MTPEEQIKQEESRQTAQTVQELIRYNEELFQLEHLPLDVLLDMTVQRESNSRRLRLVLKAKIAFLDKTLRARLSGLSPENLNSGELGRALKDLHSQRQRLGQAPEGTLSAAAQPTKGPHKPPKTHPDVGKRRIIVQQNPKLEASGICQLFDSHKVPLPPAPAWEFYRQQEGPWSRAYQKDENLRKRILVIISKDKKAEKA